MISFAKHKVDKKGRISSKICRTIDIINLSNGHREVLIDATANNIRLQDASFFLKRGGAQYKFEFHFCTVRLNEQSWYEHSWHMFTFEKDILDCLFKYEQLPVSSIGKSLHMMQELKLLKECLELDEDESIDYDEIRELRS